jgi:hypothetical protein
MFGRSHIQYIQEHFCGLLFCLICISHSETFYNNNNNNNNIYLLQVGCHPVAVITLHVFPNTTNKFT